MRVYWVPPFYLHLARPAVVSVMQNVGIHEYTQLKDEHGKYEHERGDDEELGIYRYTGEIPPCLGCRNNDDEGDQNGTEEEASRSHQHDALAVFDDVEQGIVQQEDIWVSAVCPTQLSSPRELANGSIVEARAACMARSGSPWTEGSRCLAAAV